MARSKSKNVGIIGLGIIGSRIAAALRKRNFQVFVWNRTPKLEQNFVGSPGEVAELCNLVQIFVADDEALLEVVRQLSPTLNAHHIITAHCTVAPDSMRAAAGLVQRRGARFLDAPFTGSKIAAENGQLVYYIAGDEAALKQARPILEATSKEIILIGEKIGDATVMKVATNLITAATAQVGAEALALVRKAGITPDLFARAMKSNASNSTTLEMKLPMMMARQFEPHFSVKHMLKDVRIGLKLAESYRLQLPATIVSREVLLAEMKQGRGDADYASVAQRYFPAPGTAFPPELEKIETPAPIEEAAVRQEIAVARTESLPEEKAGAAEELAEVEESVAPPAEPEATEVEEPDEAAEPEPVETGSKFTVMELLAEAEAAKVTSPEEAIETEIAEPAPESEAPTETVSQPEPEESVPTETEVKISPPEMPDELKPVESATQASAEALAESEIAETVAEKPAEKADEPKPEERLTERLNIDALLKRIGLQKAFAAIGSAEEAMHPESEITTEAKAAEMIGESKPSESTDGAKPVKPEPEPTLESKPAEIGAEPKITHATIQSPPTEPATEPKPTETPVGAEFPEPKTEESKTAEKELALEPEEETRPEETPVAVSASGATEEKVEPSDEILEGVNLSGGFRGWLSRRFRSSSRREF